MPGGQAITSGAGTAVQSRSLALAGQSLSSSVGSIVADAGDGVATTGVSATLAQGSGVSAMLVPLRSRKVGGGAASRNLVGSGFSASHGTVEPGKAFLLASSAVNFTQGAFGKSRALALTGSAVSASQQTIGPLNSVFGPLSTSFQLTAGVTNASTPFTIGHAFKQADVPTGARVTVTNANAQVTAMTYWPDGSLKFALIAGTYSSSAGVASTITLTSAAESSGLALTTTDLKNTGITASIDCGAFGLASWAGTDWDAPIYTQVSGHRMSSWQYRKAVGSDPHLVAWLEVRVYAGGAVEVLPWVEVGFLTGTAPSNKSATYAFTLGGTQRFSALIDVKERTRVPLLSGTGVFSYWLGTDPAVTPKHNTAYLMATKLVPNYGWTAPSTTTLNGLTQAYTPNTLAGVNSQMGSAGGSGSVIPSEQALYITSSGDARAYRAALVRGFSGGSWSTHYRDSTTHGVPKFGSYPNATLQGGTPAIPAGTGGSNGGAAVTHEPSFGYLPFMISGWHWFWEESAFWTIYNYLVANTNQRRGEDFGVGNFFTATAAAGIADPANGTYANRGAHWTLCMLSQTLALCPSSHPTYADWVLAWESNTAFYKAKFVDGTHSPGWVSTQGFLGGYARYSTASNWQTSSYSEGFESNYGPIAWGFSSDLGLPQSAISLANHIAVRNQAYKQVTTRSGDGSTGNYNWRRLAVFAYPYGVATGPTGTKPASWYTGGESLSILEAGYALSAIPATPGLTLKSHSSDVDMAPGSSTAADYLPTALAALAYAVDHGAAGALSGWQRVSGASNFTSALVGLNEAPRFAITPRTSTSLPAWVAALPLWHWHEIPNTRLSDLPPTTNPPSYGTPSEKVYAWCGAALKRQGSVYMFGASGGHGDYGGNEVNALVLNTATPAWQEIEPSSPLSQQIDSPWYLDLKPGSTHTYSALQFIDDRNIMVSVCNPGMGPSDLPNAPPGWPWGGSARTPAFNYTTLNWEHPDYIAAFTGVPGDTVACLCVKHQVTGDIYYSQSYSDGWYKWTNATNTWSKLSNATRGPWYVGAAMDPTRNRIFYYGGYETPPVLGPGVRDLSGNVVAATFSGLHADLVRNGYPGAVYDEANDTFLAVYNNGEIDIQVRRINAATWVVDAPTITGGPIANRQRLPGTANSICNAVQYVPELKGIVLVNKYDQNVKFMRTAL